MLLTPLRMSAELAPVGSGWNGLRLAWATAGGGARRAGSARHTAYVNAAQHRVTVPAANGDQGATDYFGDPSRDAMLAGT